MIPRNLFDFDLNLVLNMVAHEMLHVKQKAPGQVIEDKNEREFQAYYEMLFHKVFPQIPEVSDFHKNSSEEKPWNITGEWAKVRYYSKNMQNRKQKLNI